MASPLSTLVGRFAVATAGSGIANLFDWELTVEADYEDVTAHGDEWEQVTPLKQRWTFRAKGYVTVSATSYLAAFNKTGPPATVTVTAYSGSASSTVIFTAIGYPTRGNFSAPMALAEQEFEFRGAGAPSVL